MIKNAFIAKETKNIKTNDAAYNLAGKSYRRGKLYTVDLLVVNCLCQLLFILNILQKATLIRRSSVLILFPSASVPWPMS